MRKLFWIATAIFLAIAIHAGFVLAVPSFTIERSISRLSETAGPNSFFVLSAEDQARLFPTFPASSIVGACAFDVSKGQAELSADMAPGYWTLTVYSGDGDVIYALNDAQAGSGRFTVTLKMAPGLLDMLDPKVAANLDNATGWNVNTPDPTGLVVLWQPVAEPALRPAVALRLGRAVCKSSG